MLICEEGKLDRNQNLTQNQVIFDLPSWHVDVDLLSKMAISWRVWQP
jgi:hypothetical protein